MTKHDEARRAFLLGAAVGAGAVAGATLVPDALAQTHEPSTTGTGPAHSHAGGPGLGAFFNTVRTHTMEGMFADPIYGGNKDFAGWRLVGFPGGQMEFTAADMQSSEAFTRLPIVGLQAKAG